ncbi:MAG: methyltransferase domain-containing protein [Gemmatimonas sp.]|nr:methyltransferase domain-containing protein [Gemmatimonas sp.]
METSIPKLYEGLASWWHLLSAPEDYAEEAGFYSELLVAAGDPSPVTLLEIGSGGGNNASYLKKQFDLTLVDRSPGMLEQSRALNPECEHIVGDMRTLRLGCEFDRVFIQDAICYMTTGDDLRAAIETAFVHCRPGGAVLLAPDYVRENFSPSTDCGGEDSRDRALRFLEWTYDPDPTDTSYTVDYAYLLRNADGSMRVEHDRHIEGLFERATWLSIMTDVGFEARGVPFVHSEVDYNLEVFIGHRPKDS